MVEATKYYAALYLLIMSCTALALGLSVIAWTVILHWLHEEVLKLWGRRR